MAGTLAVITRLLRVRGVNTIIAKEQQHLLWREDHTLLGFVSNVAWLALKGTLRDHIEVYNLT